MLKIERVSKRLILLTMKKYNSLLKQLFLSLSILLLVSCASSTENLIDKKMNSYSFEPYIAIGKYHNENLDYIYNSIKEQILENSLETRSSNNRIKEFLTEEFIASKVTDFANEKKIIDISEYSNTIENISLQVLKSYYPFSNDSLKLKTRSTDPFTADLENNYNKIQKEYIYEILNNDKTDIVSFQTQITKIIEHMEKDKNLKSDEKQIIYLAGAIAYSSFEYWDKNTSKWEQLLSTKTNTSKIQTKAFGWKSMWRSDVEGGIGGGIGGAIAGGTVSLGILTVPGWIAGTVGGAVGTSAGNAVGQWLFD